jgi:hypothetical protein
MKKNVREKNSLARLPRSSPSPPARAQHRPPSRKHDVQLHRPQTGISNSLAVIMMFGFVLGISAVIYGGFAIRRGDVDQGKMSIIGGAIIAAAPAAVFAFFKIFGLDANSAVGVGNF